MSSISPSPAARPAFQRPFHRLLRLVSCWAAVELLVLWGFVVAQPLYDLLSRQAGFLVAHRVMGLRIVGLALVLSLLLPGLLALTIALVRRCSDRFGRTLHVATIGVLLAGATLQTTARTESMPGWLACIVAATIGLAAMATYRGYATARLLLRMAAPAVLVFPLVFLASGSTVRLLHSNVDANGPFPPVAADVPVVVVVFDELPLSSLLDEQRHIDRRQFPHFAAFADQATWFRNASGVHQQSEHAVPAIVTGCWPDMRRIPTAGDHPLSLFSLLAGSYELHVSEAFTQLCPKLPEAHTACKAGRTARSVAAAPACAAADRWPHDVPSDSNGPSDWRPHRQSDGQLDLSAESPSNSPSDPPSGPVCDWPSNFPAGPRSDSSPAFSVGELAFDLLIVYAHLIVPADWRDRLPSISHTWRGFTGAMPRFAGTSGPAPGDYGLRAAQMRRFIASIRSSDRPTLHFLHVVLPHVPWSYTAEGRLYLPENAMCVPGLKFPAEVWRHDRWFVRQALYRYRLQLAYVDRLLGQLLDRLRACNLYDRSLIVVTADHGAAFEPGGSRRDPAATTRPEDIFAVPLFIKRPGQQTGTISDRNVQTIDILPTIAEAIGISLPWPIDGHSAWNASLPERPVKRMVNAEGRPVELPGRLLLEPLFYRRDRLPATAPTAAPRTRRDALGKSSATGATASGSTAWLDLEDRLRGQPLSACRFDSRPGSAGEVRLAPELARWQRLYGDRFVPAFAMATLRPTEGAMPDDARIVVALNGTVWAVAPLTGQRPAARRLTVLLPPEAINEGENRLQMFAALPDPSAPLGVCLRRLRVVPAVLVGPPPLDNPQADGLNAR